MNIYKTKSGTYINLDQVQYIINHSGLEWSQINIVFSNKVSMELSGDQVEAFLDYLDNRLEGVFAGYA